jgi:hypothetical protein
VPVLAVSAEARAKRIDGGVDEGQTEVTAACRSLIADEAPALPRYIQLRIYYRVRTVGGLITVEAGRTGVFEERTWFVRVGFVGQLLRERT